MKVLFTIILFTLFSLNTFAFTASEIAQAKRSMIRESTKYYASNCACPYHTTKNGSRCGKRSAYSRPGGIAPYCYEADISDKKAIDYLSRE